MDRSKLKEVTPLYILIVDDDPMIVNAYTALLEGEGHRVCSAQSGRSALIQMRIEKPDVVLLDMMLGPGMSGWDVAREKFMDSTLRGIPLVILTGLADDEVNANPLSGLLALLRKPTSLAELNEVLSKVTPRNTS